MSEELRLLCVLAHPDDESLGLGGTLAKYASEGVGTYVVSATRGERGRFGNAAERPAPEVVGRVREAELRAAARELGVREVSFLDYIDGDLDQVDSREAIAKIVHHLRRIRPQVVVTFGPEGGYGHPDHIAISQLTTAAIVCAADSLYKSTNDTDGGLPAHRVSKLYYMAWRRSKWEAFQSAFRAIKFQVDGVEREAAPWPDWAITTTVDTAQHWPAAWRAILQHKTQLTIYGKLEGLSEEQHQSLWGVQEFYRAFSTVNGGRKVEADLFEGLRESGREQT